MKDVWVIHSHGAFLHSIETSSQSKWGELEEAMEFQTSKDVYLFLDAARLAGPPNSYGPMHMKEACVLEILEL